MSEQPAEPARTSSHLRARSAGARGRRGRPGRRPAACSTIRRWQQSLPFDITAAAFARLAEPPVTGDPRVDDALARLGELPDLPVAEHLSVYEDVHRRLHDALADLDAG